VSVFSKLLYNAKRSLDKTTTTKQQHDDLNVVVIYSLKTSIFT